MPVAMTGMDYSNMSRRALLGGLAAFSGGAAFAGAPATSVRPLVRPGDVKFLAAPPARDLIAQAGLGGKISYVVADARTGRVLESMNPVLGLPPASVAKSITAQYALEALGPAHAFSTRLVGDGALRNGKLTGDLILVGGGDPTLDTNAIAEMAAALKAAGVREVTGRFLVHSGAIPHVHEIDPGQPNHLGYNPAVSGLNLNYNRVHFEWKRSGGAYQVTMDARTKKYRPAVAMARMNIVDRDVPVYTYANGGTTERWTVAKSALGTGGARWLPVRQPELYAGEVFQTFARSHGITLASPAKTNIPVRGVVLVDRHSPPLAAILKTMLAYSTNLTAEVTGMGASIARGRTINGLADSGREMSSWMKTRLGARKPRFVDHSGLGDRTRISAGDMVNGLVRIGADSTLKSILKPIAMRDAKGDLDPTSKAQLFAKTGTLNFVSALTGYLDTDAGQHLAFAIFTADMPRRNQLSEAERERPPGAKSWSRRSRKMQWALMNRWLESYTF